MLANCKKILSKKMLLQNTVDFETSRLRDFKTSRLQDFETSRKVLIVLLVLIENQERVLIGIEKNKLKQ